MTILINTSDPVRSQDTKTEHLETAQHVARIDVRDMGNGKLQYQTVCDLC